MGKSRFDSWVGKTCWRRDRLPILGFLGFPYGSAGKESACKAGDLGLVPGLGRPLEKGILPTPVFWPGEFCGLYSLWGHKESDMTERLSLSLFNSDMDHVVTVNVGRLDLEKTYCRQQT